MTFALGKEIIKETESYTHLGLACDNFKYLSTKKPLTEAGNKLRGTLLSIINSGIHTQRLNPITSRTIYSSIVIPKALYGCELWNKYSLTDIRKLETSQTCKSWVAIP
jgi:hypothetical protein